MSAAERLQEITPAAVAELRRAWPADRVAAALALVEARRRARVKFPELAARLVSDPEGIEQASSLLVARHKAARFPAGQRVFDLACGIGGDATALAGRGPFVAVDRSLLRAWMAARNLAISLEAMDGAGSAPLDTARRDPVRVVCADLSSLELPSGALVHVDPARRHAGRRRAVRLTDYEPGREVLVALVERERTGGGGACVKLGPGLDLAEVPAGSRDEIELVSEHGRLVQALWWSGALARSPGQRVATRLPAGETFSGAVGVAAPGWQETFEALPGRYLLEPDPALERAGLLGEYARRHEFPELAPGLGLLVGERAATPGGWCTAYRIRWVQGWNEERVVRRLRAEGAHVLAVKTRGGAVDPSQVQRSLGKATAAARTPAAGILFVLRLGRRKLALLCEKETTGSA